MTREEPAREEAPRHVPFLAKVSRQNCPKYNEELGMKLWLTQVFQAHGAVEIDILPNQHAQQLMTNIPGLMIAPEHNLAWMALQKDAVFKDAYRRGAYSKALEYLVQEMSEQYMPPQQGQDLLEAYETAQQKQGQGAYEYRKEFEKLIQKYETVSGKHVSDADKVKYFVRGVREDPSSELYKAKQDREIRSETWAWKELHRLCTAIKRTAPKKDEEKKPTGRQRDQLRVLQGLPETVQSALRSSGDTMTNLRQALAAPGLSTQHTVQLLRWLFVSSALAEAAAQV